MGDEYGASTVAGVIENSHLRLCCSHVINISTYHFVNCLQTNKQKVTNEKKNTSMEKQFKHLYSNSRFIIEI